MAQWQTIWKEKREKGGTFSCGCTLAVFSHSSQKKLILIQVFCSSSNRLLKHFPILCIFDGFIQGKEGDVTAHQQQVVTAAAANSSNSRIEKTACLNQELTKQDGLGWTFLSVLNFGPFQGFERLFAPTTDFGSIFCQQCMVSVGACLNQMLAMTGMNRFLAPEGGVSD